ASLREAFAAVRQIGLRQLVGSERRLQLFDLFVLRRGDRLQLGPQLADAAFQIVVRKRRYLANLKYGHLVASDRARGDRVEPGTSPGRAGAEGRDRGAAAGWPKPRHVLEQERRRVRLAEYSQARNRVNVEIAVFDQRAQLCRGPVGARFDHHAYP